MSSSRSAFSALKPKTLPMIDEVRFAIEPSSKRSRSYAMRAMYCPSAPGAGRGALDRVDPGLRRDAKSREHVGRLRLVIRGVVAHLGIRSDTRAPAATPGPGVRRGRGSRALCRRVRGHRPPRLDARTHGYK